VLIETILASFEMHEILWELRDHSAGLNCGRWDYIFSFIKKFRARRDFITPDRASITMDKAFLAAYVDLLIQTCHRRGIHAMGGMAAQIPIKDDPAANDAATAKVAADKLREVRAGHDGTWVAHPGLVGVAKKVFDEHMPAPNQLERKREEVRITRDDLLRLPEGSITEKGLRQNIDVGILYVEAWLGGSGAVPLYNLMEDAATAEISRTQLWQWVHHGAKLDDGRTIDAELYRGIRGEALSAILERLGETRREYVTRAARIFDELILAPELADFLTIPAYAELLQLETTH
jgi:malate synthase